jgi:hypothetical protein
MVQLWVLEMEMEMVSEKLMEMVSEKLMVKLLASGA